MLLNNFFSFEWWKKTSPSQGCSTNDGTGLEDILAVPQQAGCWQWLCHRGLVTEVGQDGYKEVDSTANGTKSALCSRKMSFLTGQTNAARWEVACEGLGFSR